MTHRTLNTIYTKLLNDRKIRIEATSWDILLFFAFYFPHYIMHPMADFQKEILSLLQDADQQFIALVAFRGSAKTTFCSLLLPIWAALGCHQKKFIVLVCQNQQRAQQQLINIKMELESNERLIADYGPFIGTVEQWSINTLVLANGTRITAVSVGESIRGIRHGQYRPDLIISDDVEDVQSASVQEARDRLWQFINGELIPAGDLDTRYVFIGNLVHEDSAMMRIKKAIEGHKLEGTYRQYPLIHNGAIAWKGKFPNFTAIEKLKKGLGSLTDYLREYLLQIIPEGNQLIFPEDINRYEEKIFETRADFIKNIFSLDPAISERQTADNSAITHYRIYGKKKPYDAYVMPHPINRKMTGLELVAEIKRLVASLPRGEPYVVLIENVAYQRMLVETLQADGIHAIAVGIDGLSKRSRVYNSRYFIKTHLYFPKTGTEEVERQLFGFGVERYDDLVDSITLLCKYLIDVALEASNDIVMVCSERFPKNIFDSSSDGDWADREDKEIFASIGHRKRFNHQQ
jgi:phage terminase large subunit-like protein